VIQQQLKADVDENYKSKRPLDQPVPESKFAFKPLVFVSGPIEVLERHAFLERNENKQHKVFIHHCTEKSKIDEIDHLTCHSDEL
jgi:hypothetical protein